MAVNDNYLNIANMKLKQGRTISIIDIENKSKVCILGSDVATTLFNLSEPLGEKIKINGDNYTVIGLLEQQGTSMGNNIDEMILIPITTAKHLGEDTSITNLYVKVENEDNINTTINRLENYIRQTLEISSDYYSVSSQDSVLDTMENVNNTLSLLLGGIASISLIVGGILGVIFGISIGYLAENFNFTFNSNGTIVLISFLASSLIGLIFGIFPAYRAAKLNPIDALRTE